MHPHHHGASALQAALESVPVVIERDATSGFDFLDTPSCQVHKAIIEDNTTEVIMHMQVSVLCHSLGICEMTQVYTALQQMPADPLDGSRSRWS